MPDHTTPPLRRRLCSLVYECLLLFGVLFLAGWLFSGLLDQRHALALREASQFWLFGVLAAYFIWFWTHGGQTLAMKTWKIRLVFAKTLGPVPASRALLRYLIAWSWILPGLAAAWMLDASGWLLVAIPFFNIILWALTAFLDPEQQFLHDRIAGTKLVQVAADTR